MHHGPQLQDSRKCHPRTSGLEKISFLPDSQPEPRLTSRDILRQTTRQSLQSSVPRLTIRQGERQIQQGNHRHSAICASTKRQKVKSSHARCLTYRTSSSPPSQTRNPPSGCLSRLSHCHLHQSDAHHASTEMNNSHRVSIYQSQCLTTNHGKRQHGRITACQMRSLAMATSKSSGGVLHGTESCDDTVLVSTSCTPLFFSRSFYYLI